MSPYRPYPIPFCLMAMGFLATACGGQRMSANADDVDVDTEAPAEVVVASIDPPARQPGAELRLARSVLAQAGMAGENAQNDSMLDGYLAVALTGDPAAVEELIRALGDAETCGAATTAIAFLPRRLARRPLWLALRLDCSSVGALAAAQVLGFDDLVAAAREADELPPVDDTADSLEEAQTQDSSRCDAVATTLRSLDNDHDRPLPTLLAQLAQETWRLPTNEDELCRDDALAAAIRMRRGDRAVQLALDLELSSHDELPEHIVHYVERFGLGAVTRRLLDHEAEADGRLCAAFVQAGLLDEMLPMLGQEPEVVPQCLLPATLAILAGDSGAHRETLAAIAAASRHPGCGAGAFVAALTLVELEERPPMWVRDAVLLGRAIAALLRDSPGAGETPSADRLTELHTAVQQLRPRDDNAPTDSLIRLYQRDIRTVLDNASGSRRAALSLLLETGGR